MSPTHVWRFGYGSNIGLEVLQQKKNLNPSKYLTGTIKGWQLYFMPGFAHVEPGWAAVRPHEDGPHGELHGSAFCIPIEEAEGLDRQEGGYNVLPCQFSSYDGEIVEKVGLYVPKNATSDKKPEGIPSMRYLRLLQKGARQGGLAKEWIDRLDSVEYYVTPPHVRAQTKEWVSEFEVDSDRFNTIWTAEKLSKHNGSDPDLLPAHTCLMGYIIKISPDMWVFSSWKGHSLNRRNLLQFNGKSMDTNDIRFGEPGFLPIPKVEDCSEEEKEYLHQVLDSLLHRGGVIVARLKEEIECATDYTIEQ
jgi:ribosomal protein S16